MPDEETPKNDSQNSFNWKDIFIIVLLILAVVLTFFRIKKAQKGLTEYLKTKKQVLNGLLVDIQRAQKDKQRLICYKHVANVCLRFLIVGLLVWINFEYLTHYFVKSKLPEKLSAITDFNAILLLIVTVFIFLRYGSFFELKTIYDSVQNSVLQWVFNKKIEAIDALLQSNLASRDSILKEIEETEIAIQSNENLLHVDDQHLIVIKRDSDSTF